MKSVEPGKGFLWACLRILMIAPSSVFFIIILEESACLSDLQIGNAGQDNVYDSQYPDVL